MAQSVQGLSSKITGNSIVLSWKETVRRKDGSVLTDISGFKVYKAVSPISQDCPDCPARFSENFFVKRPSEKEEKGGTVRFEDTKLSYGNKYVYAVQAIHDRNREGELSNPIAVYWDAPPVVPQDLKAASGNGWVKITWKAPEKYADGKPAGEDLLYNVYRRQGNAAEKKLKEASLISFSSFIDKSVVNGIAYAYRVNAVRSIKGTLIEGPLSEPASATPEDQGPASPD